jgi:hypothetical protein
MAYVELVHIPTLVLILHPQIEHYDCGALFVHSFLVCFQLFKDPLF